jgi:uncharacterized damage-inducible protein DinB
MSNPYAENLAGRDPLSVIEEGFKAIPDTFNTIDPERLNQPWKPGKWTFHEILAHLADCELVFSTRLRWVLYEDNPTLIPFDQDPWMEGWRKQQEPYPETLARWKALRAATLRLVKAATLADLDRPANHTERGRITARDVLEIMAGHELNHRAQL